ncbi:MAG TPA: hypothetical protein VGQ65_01960 [Thermoanaerobaculia bacterium]|jgi:hypothetical protein|nr:hypothetical protein [Thermoanaerobaculia bacterium]
MRIQQTDQILKDARIARRGQHVHEQNRSGMFQRAWQSLTGIFKRS